jgi:hypothetical protein
MRAIGPAIGHSLAGQQDRPEQPGDVARVVPFRRADAGSLIFGRVWALDVTGEV